MVNPFKQFFMGSNDEENEVHNIPQQQVAETPVEKDETKYEGKIIKVSDEGWGFIISKEIPFTRIFFHWTSLVQDTLKFTELKRGMHVEFVAVNKGDRGYHAIKIRVTKETESN